MNVARRSLFVLLVTALALALASCGGTATKVDTGIAAPDDVAAQIADGAMVIDVRTPAEFATGHVADAVNIDLSSQDFESRLDALDKNAAYVVYCQSGNRSTQAVEQMVDMGFDGVVNGGGIGALAGAGVEIR